MHISDLVMYMYMYIHVYIPVHVHVSVQAREMRMQCETVSLQLAEKDTALKKALEEIAAKVNHMYMYTVCKEGWSRGGRRDWMALKFM